MITWVRCIVTVAAFAQVVCCMSAMGQSVTIGGSMEGNLSISPGDTIRAGHDFSMPGNHPGVTVTVSSGVAQINVVCPDGNAQTLSITFPEQSYTVGVNDASWYPSADQSSSLVYQGATMAPASLCGGKPGYAPNGATFAASFQSTDASDPLNARFHYSDKSAGAWSSATNVHRGNGSTSQSKVPVFGREVIVDHQRVDGEPSISIDGADRIYVSGPFGFSTTASYVWRSEDHGESFHLVPGNLSPYGKPFVTCAGGGDSALALDRVDRLFLADLQGLTDVSNSVSSDEGTTWLSTCNAANAAGVDRPWIATYGDPRNGGALYQTVDEVEQCITPCGEGEGGLGQIGSNIVEITRSQDGITFTPAPAQQIEPDGIVSGIVSGIVTDASGGVYIAHTGYVDPATGNFLGGSDTNGNDNANAEPAARNFRLCLQFNLGTARNSSRLIVLRRVRASAEAALRVRAISLGIAFQLALAVATGIRFVVSDRADVLDKPRRKELAALLLKTDVDQAIVLATCEEPAPASQPDGVRFFDLTQATQSRNARTLEAASLRPAQASAAIR